MCLSPITIQTEDRFGTTVSMSVLCCKCIECLKDRQNSWKIRLCEEFKDHLYCYFFTLTYNETSVPFNIVDGEKVLTLCKNDVQLWIKRNRMRFERLRGHLDLKYFICGEYGPNTGRPHYHGIFFTDLSPTLVAQFFSDWRDVYGFVNWSQVGKKKEAHPQSATMLLNTVANLLHIKAKLSDVYSNFPRLVQYLPSSQS